MLCICMRGVTGEMLLLVVVVRLWLIPGASKMAAKFRWSHIPFGLTLGFAKSYKL